MSQLKSETQKAHNSMDFIVSFLKSPWTPEGGEEYAQEMNFLHLIKWNNHPCCDIPSFLRDVIQGRYSSND